MHSHSRLSTHSLFIFSLPIDNELNRVFTRPMNRIPTPEELNMIEPEPEKASVLEATRFAIERHKARRNKMDRERDERNKAKGETK